MNGLIRVKGYPDPIPEDLFLEALRMVQEIGEAPEVLFDGQFDPQAPGASQTKVKLSRMMHTLARRRGLEGQAGVDQQYRIDNGLPDAPLDPLTHKPLVFPDPHDTKTGGKFTPRPPSPPEVTHLPPPTSDLTPRDSLRPLYPPRTPSTKIHVPEEVKELVSEEFYDSPPESLKGWRVMYVSVEKMPKAPAHVHKDTGNKHVMTVHTTLPGVGVVYCNHQKVQYYITESEDVSE